MSQAEKEKTACKAEQIHKIKTTFTQNGSFFVNLLSFASSSFFSSLRTLDYPSNLGNQNQIKLEVWAFEK